MLSMNLVSFNNSVHFGILSVVIYSSGCEHSNNELLGLTKWVCIYLFDKVYIYFCLPELPKFLLYI